VMTRFTSGYYRSGSSSLYVNRGLGTTGPPVRLGVSPEIGVLVLRRAVVATAAARPETGGRASPRRAPAGPPAPPLSPASSLPRGAR